MSHTNTGGKQKKAGRHVFNRLVAIINIVLDGGRIRRYWTQLYRKKLRWKVIIRICNGMVKLIAENKIKHDLCWFMYSVYHHSIFNTSPETIWLCCCIQHWVIIRPVWAQCYQPRQTTVHRCSVFINPTHSLSHWSQLGTRSQNHLLLIIGCRFTFIHKTLLHINIKCIPFRWTALCLTTLCPISFNGRKAARSTGECRMAKWLCQE